jgi:radical SAM protein with 4Fe4S-binding SPASM domain
MGMRFRCGILIDPRMDGSTEPCSLRLPPDKIAELYNRDEAFIGRGEVEDTLYADSVRHDTLFSCPGGTWAFYVSPYGELFFCNSVRKPSIDLGKHSFKQGFHGLFPKIRSQKFETTSPCKKCLLRSVCLWCPGKAYLETGNREAPIEYYCELAKSSRSASTK